MLILLLQFEYVCIMIIRLCTDIKLTLCAVRPSILIALWPHICNLGKRLLLRTSVGEVFGKVKIRLDCGGDKSKIFLITNSYIENNFHIDFPSNVPVSFRNPYIKIP